MKSMIDIIIPTWNNPDYLIPCVQSIQKTGVLNSGFCKLIIVDNGEASPVNRGFKDFPNTIVVSKGKNLGWEGGLKFGLEHSDAPFVCFQNDDTLIPKSSSKFYHNLLYAFQDPKVAAVGPITTTASGMQSIYHPATPMRLIEAPWLIFFTVLIRRKYLDEVGGVDDQLPGGDDFDLCMRFRKAGKSVLIQPDSFLIHHGFVTGNRVRGDHTVKGGWNNIEFTDDVNKGLIQKHGFKFFIESRFGLDYSNHKDDFEDKEGPIIISMLNGHKNILELGCGGKKVIEKSIGVDRVPKGQKIPNLFWNVESLADVVCDVEKEILPFTENSQDAVIAQHLLEHCIDPIRTIENWGRVLRKGGYLILVVPDEDLVTGIPLNPEHLHAFTENSLSNLMQKLGFKTLSTKKSGNGMSFVGCFEKC